MAPADDNDAYDDSDADLDGESVEEDVEVEVEGQDIPMHNEPPPSKPNGADIPAPKKPSSQRILDDGSPAPTTLDTPSESPLPSPPAMEKDPNLGGEVGQGRSSKSIATPQFSSTVSHTPIIKTLP